MTGRERDWERWEATVAEDLGGERVPGSGAGERHKGDVRAPGLLVECKWTGGTSYRLTRALWERVSMWARNDQRVPAVAVSAAHGRAVVVSEWWWCERHPHADFGEQVSSDGVTVDPQLVVDGPMGRRIGHERVVVAPYDGFVRAARGEAA